MELTKFKLTASKTPGFMMVVYADNHFKSVLNEFKPHLTEQQLNLILNQIPDNPNDIEALMVSKFKGKITIERVKAIGEEPASTEETPTNIKIAIWCELYETAHNVKYKTGVAEAGKIKGLAITADELRLILTVYMASDEWFTKPKSISNFVKHFNEVRALAYAKPQPKKHPLPYNHEYFVQLPLVEKRAYQDYLRANGYVFQTSGVRGGVWIKQHQTVNQ